MAQLWHGIDSPAPFGPKIFTGPQNLRQKSHSLGLAARDKAFSAGIVADFNDNGINGVEELGR
ncbi:hypothetical protein CO683_19000 [Bradyrhizobium ottawaense]|nr:hypothetical protein [Bradyrhizobium sp. CCBAU 25360]PDT67860.1 hypothetical protein CO683_19000 [Bradyrhizobium ottawaense]